MNFFKKLLSPFSKMKSSLGKKISSLFSKGIDPVVLNKLEELFFEADLGPSLSLALREKVKKFAKQDTPSEEILFFLKKSLLEEIVPPKPPQLAPLHVVLMVGVNGSGKTTSLAKLAHYYKTQGKTVLIAAADTFRAAAVEQLERWAEKISVFLIKSAPKADPSSVAFDALSSAEKRGADVVLIDTAGRLQNKTDLMQELAKVRKVLAKKLEGAPHETLLTLDATLGQNGIDQAKTFHSFCPITGLILTKLDGSAKGGALLAVQRELKLPVQWVGLGESVEDLTPFDPEEYVNALLNLSK